MTAHILILAAGRSSRMGGTDKLTQQVGGEPLIRHVARQALATGCPVAVTLPPEADAFGAARRQALVGLDVKIQTVPDPSQGMAASLVAGLAAIPQQAAVLILLADMPDLTMQDLALLLDRHRADPTAILRGASNGRPGHPVLFPADLRPDLSQLSGDDGARSVLQRHAGRVVLVPLPGRHALTDLDTPADWAAWRAARDAQPPER